MSGGGGGILIIRPLLQDAGSRLTEEQKDRLQQMIDAGEVPLSITDALALARIVYQVARRP